MKCEKCGNDKNFSVTIERVLEIVCDKGKVIKGLFDDEDLLPKTAKCLVCRSKKIKFSVEDFVLIRTTI